MAVMRCNLILYNDLFLLRIRWHIIAWCTGSLRYYLYYGRESSNGTSCPLYCLNKQAIALLSCCQTLKNWKIIHNRELYEVLGGCRWPEHQQQRQELRQLLPPLWWQRVITGCLPIGRDLRSISRPQKQRRFVIRTWSKTIQLKMTECSTVRPQFTETVSCRHSDCRMRNEK